MQVFNHDDVLIVVKSPGRTNLIGEHTDYDEGLVLPSATDRAICLEVEPSRGYQARIPSGKLNDDVGFDIRYPGKSSKTSADYLIGMVNELNTAGYVVEGFDCAFAGNIPIGVCMSSSAAIEVGLAYVLNEMFNLGISRRDLAKSGQRPRTNSSK